MIKQYSYIVETIILYGVICLLGWHLGSPGFIGFHFHPFYFAVLLITLRYGYWKSICSTIIACCLYIIYFLLETSFPSFYNFFDECYHPIAFLAFWMFLGFMVDLDKRKIIESNEKKEYLERIISSRDTEIKKINYINENISEKLVKSTQGFNILFHITKNLFHEDISIFYRTTYDLLVKVIETPKAYVFCLDGDNFKLVAPKEAEAGISNLLSNKKIDDIRKQHKFFSIDMVEEDIVSHNEPVFMGPILHEATDTLFGLIVVEQLDFLKFNANAFRTFKNLCKWIGEILYFRSEQNQKIFPHEEKINDFDYVVKSGSTQQEIRKIIQNAFCK